MKNETETSEQDLQKYTRFHKLYCPILRKHVLHGIKETKESQTIKCLSCGDTYEFHIDGRNRVEKSLWDSYTLNKDKVNLSPPPVKKSRKRWNLKYLIYRG